SRGSKSKNCRRPRMRGHDGKKNVIGLSYSSNRSWAMWLNNRAGRICATALGLALSLPGLCTSAGAETITGFDPSGSSGTHADAINTNGVIAGYYTDKNHVFHGFVRSARGRIASFSVSGATATIANAINDSGTIAGRYADQGGRYHGFVRAATGNVTTFSHSGASGTAPAG